MSDITVPEKIVFVRKKKKSYVKWIIISISAVILIAGAVFGYMVWRFYDNVKETVTIEAGSQVPSAEDFLKQSMSGVSCNTDLSGIDCSKPGDHTVELAWGPFTQNSKLVIRDTVAPTGETRDLLMTVKDNPKPEDFIVSYDDVTDVTIRYVLDPDMKKEGTQTVNILLADEADNHTILKAKLTLYDENNAPVIQGAENKSVFVGDTISYRKGVSVKSSTDEEPVLDIDSSAVDLDTPGVYPVTYTATDIYGRSSSVSINVEVEEKPENYDDIVRLNEMVDQKLAELIQPGMSEIEKAFAIFRFVRLNIPWNRGRTEHDPVAQAIRGMEGNVGDCYTHAVTCQILLEHAGFVVALVEKNSDTGMHFWLMVYINGAWYHMDPSNIYIHNYVAFLSTDAQLQEYARKYRPHLYDLENSLLPSTPKTSPADVVYKDGDYILTILEPQN